MIQNQNPVRQLENTQIRIFLSRFLVKNKKMTQVSLGRKGASCWQGFGELTVLQMQDQTRTRQGKSIAKVLQQNSLTCWDAAGATATAATPPLLWTLTSIHLGSGPYIPSAGRPSTSPAASTSQQRQTAELRAP